MTRLFLCGVAFVLLLTACTTPPTPEEIKAAHYGAFPSDYRTTLDPLLDSRHQQLGDPFEVVSMSRPHKDWMGDGNSRTWGYAVVVVYKAPNPLVNAPSYIFREKFFFVNRKVIAATNITNLGDVLGSSAENNLDSANAQLSGDDSDSGSDDSADTSSAQKHKRKH